MRSIKNLDLFLTANCRAQRALQEEISGIVDLNQSSSDEPVSASIFADLLTTAYMDSVIEETLQIYPASVAEFPGVVPIGGRAVKRVFET